VTRMASREFFRGRSVLITGGSGSLGRGLAEELVRRKPKVIRVFDQDENGLWEMQEAYRGNTNLRFLLGNVRDEERLRMACEGIDVVIHAAALKHVQACEYNPFEAVRTNVLGTQNAIAAARDADVERFVFTSTDKAVNPSNVMGTTKLLGEKLTVAANYYRGRHRTSFSCVRFGNVIGSRGSALHLFRGQALAGGPLTLTDPRMTRFVMTLAEAVRLVLKAVEMTRGGETFVLKMDSVRIADAAELMAGAHGRSGEPMTVRHTGAKPGEKLYEELMTEEEVERAYEMEDMFVITPGMPELVPKDLKPFPKARKARHVPYRSDQVAALSPKALGDFLRREGLL